jgi:putative membrane protein insertion efficiency factor
VPNLETGGFRMKRMARLAVLFALRAYKWVLSPLLPPCCRYLPSCSEYAMEAVARHGIFSGGWMALCRVLRCHPFVSGGFDPVPCEESKFRSAAAVQGIAVEDRPWSAKSNLQTMGFSPVLERESES